MVSMKQLRYFTEIVECRSFSLAAARLHIAQSALSRQIKALEASVQTELLQRLPRHVEPTPAGKAFYAGAKKMLFLLNDTLAHARGVGRHDGGVIRLAHTSSVPLAGGLLHKVQAVLAANAGLSLDITQRPSEQHADEIEAGRCDLGLVRLPVQVRHPHVRMHTLYEEALMLAVSQRHPLARRPSVPVAALRHERFVSLPHSERGGLSFHVASLCMRHGFFPAAAQAISRKTTLLNLVDAGLGIALLPQGMRAIAPPTVRFIALQGSGHGTTVAMLCRTDAPALVEHFAAQLKAQYPPAPPSPATAPA